MAAVAGGVTLATIAAREGVSQEEAEESMDELVSEGVVRKETRNGETVYVATGKQATTQPVSQPKVEMAPAVPTGAPTKFCRNCGAKISRESKFCEECGTRLDA